MSSDAQDIAVARYLKQIGLASDAQIQQALQTQSRAVEQGTRMSLAEALVEQGVLTPAQRETVEKKARAGPAAVQQLGKYKLLRKLGEGGMGAVYLAEDVAGGRKVALKVLPRKYSDDAEFTRRFRREANAAFALEHANIVRAFEIGEDLGYHFYAMEFCEGESLEKVLKRDGLISWRRALEIVREVADGLSYAHARGFVHRDIKPANIIVAKDGTCKILDLGLSKNIAEAQVSFQTLSGAILGTPHYISPEQARSDKTIDGRADIYSLGATLYHLLTGEPPFTGESAYAIISQHVQAALPNPQDLAEDIPDGAVHVLRRMMAKDVSARYTDGAELIADVQRVLDGQEPKSQSLDAAASSVKLLRDKLAGARRRRAVPYRTPARTSSGRAWYVMGAAAAGLGIVVAISVLSSGGKPPTAQAPTAQPSPTAPPPAAAHPPPPAAAASAAPTEKSWLVEVRALPPRERARRVADRLVELNPGFSGKHGCDIREGEVVEFSFEAIPVRDISPLAVLKELRSLVCSGRWEEATGKTVRSPLADLKPIEGLKLEKLNIGLTQVTDLAPLKNMPLRDLNLGATQVYDLAPLAGMRLEALFAAATPISDLRPLQQMPLAVLDVSNTRVASHVPLRGMPLRHLSLKFVPERDTELLRGLTSLESVNGKPVAEFLAALPPSAAPDVDAPARWTGAIDLLPSVDAAADAVAGAWSGVADGLRGPGTGGGRLELPYRPPPEYDVTFSFTPSAQKPDLGLLLPVNGRQILFQIGAWGSWVGFDVVGSRHLRERAKPHLESGLPAGRRFRATVQVRRTRLAAYLEGRLVDAIEGADLALLDVVAALRPRDASGLALVSHAQPVVFNEVRVLEIGGSGRLTRAAAAPAAVDPPNPPTPAPVPPSAGARNLSASRGPEPSAAAQKAAEKQVREIYKAELSKPSTENALKLIEQARQMRDDPAGTFVLLREARDMALLAGALSVSMAAVDAMLASFELDPVSLRISSLDAFGKRALAPAEALELAGRYAAVAEEAALADRYDAAKSAAGKAALHARKAGREVHAARHQARLEELTLLGREFDRLAQPLKTLEKRPDDPAANGAVGSFLCLLKGDWERGLPHLARAGDPKLAGPSRDDLSGPSSPEAQVAVADAWWDRAEAERLALRKSRLRERAALWYRRALPAVTGLARGKADKRVNEWIAELPQVDLMRAIDPARDRVSGPWTIERGVLNSPSDLLARLSIPYDVPPDYDLNLVASRKGRADVLFVGLVVAGRQLGVVLDAVGGTRSELLVSGRTSYSGGVFTGEKPARILCRVRGSSVKVAVEGRMILGWQGDPSAIVTNPDWKVPREGQLFVGSSGATYQISKLALTILPPLDK